MEVEEPAPDEVEEPIRRAAVGAEARDENVGVEDDLGPVHDTKTKPWRATDVEGRWTTTLPHRSQSSEDAGAGFGEALASVFGALADFFDSPFAGSFFFGPPGSAASALADFAT